MTYFSQGKRRFSVETTTKILQRGCNFVSRLAAHFPRVLFGFVDIGASRESAMLLFRNGLFSIDFSAVIL